jgi:L-malate glycosyltransferase
MFFVEVPHRVGGAQRSLLAAIRELPSKGWHPFAVFPGEGECVRMFREANIETHVVPAPERALIFNKGLLKISTREKVEILASELLPYCRDLAKKIDQWDVDAVHFNTIRGILVAGVAARIAARPTVLHFRGYIPFRGAYWWCSLAMADRIVLVSNAMREYFPSAVASKIRVVYNGVRVDGILEREVAREKISKRIGLDVDYLNRVPLFLSLSSPVPLKGLHHLLGAVKIARNRGIEAHFVLAGEPEEAEYYGWLVRRRDELGLADCVHFIGHVSNPLDLLAGSDCLVFPSIARETVNIGTRTFEVDGVEGFPRSIIEAMAIGIPTIASQVGGVREQLEQGVTGLIVKPGDEEDLAKAIVMVANDSIWRVAAGRKAATFAKTQFSLDAAAAGLASSLDEISVKRGPYQ